MLSIAFRRVERARAELFYPFPRPPLLQTRLDAICDAATEKVELLVTPSMVEAIRAALASGGAVSNGIFVE